MGARVGSGTETGCLPWSCSARGFVADTLGAKVGYIVKQDARASAETNIVFVTTGVAIGSSLKGITNSPLFWTNFMNAH